MTRIIEGTPAYYDGRLQRGDQILAVDNTIFKNVNHQFAVNTLKNTGDRVSLLYLKNPHPDLESVARIEDNVLDMLAKLERNFTNLADVRHDGGSISGRITVSFGLWPRAWQ